MGKNSMSEITKVMMETARLRAMNACDMLVNRSLRGNTTGRFEVVVRTVAHALFDEVGIVAVEVWLRLHEI